MTSCPHCGCDNDAPPRSSVQHRRFFAVVAAAFDQWPHDHGFQPEDSEHLRAYLLIMAGWKEQAEVQFSKGDPEAIEAAAITLKVMMKKLGKRVFANVDMDAKKIIGVMPRSIAYMTKQEMDHFEACRIFGRIDDIICATICVESTDKLLEEAKRAA